MSEVDSYARRIDAREPRLRTDGSASSMEFSCFHGVQGRDSQPRARMSSMVDVVCNRKRWRPSWMEAMTPPPVVAVPNTPPKGWAWSAEGRRQGGGPFSPSLLLPGSVPPRFFFFFSVAKYPVLPCFFSMFSALFFIFVEWCSSCRRRARAARWKAQRRSIPIPSSWHVQNVLWRPCPRRKRGDETAGGSDCWWTCPRRRGKTMGTRA